MRPTSRLTAATLAGVVIAGLTGSPAMAADPAAASSSSAWLAAQAVDDAMPGFMPGSPDYGLTLDAIMAITASGDAALAEAMVTKLDQGDTAGNYFTFRAYDMGDDDRVAGDLAKTLVTAEVAGRDPHAFGTYDLLGGRPAAPSRPRTSPRAAGSPTATARSARVSPTTVPTWAVPTGANVFGQAMAVLGFAGIRDNQQPVMTSWSASSAARATGDLYSYNDGAQTCDEGKASDESAPDRDATGLAATHPCSPPVPPGGPTASDETRSLEPPPGCWASRTPAGVGAAA